MKEFRCRICGGPLMPQEDAVTAVCEYCGSVLVLPRTDPAVFNRALELLREKKFDQAAAMFRRCVIDNPQDAEVHWNLLLCKFGIEYVEDPDGGRVPTCNTLIYDPITEDEDYQDALRFSGDIAARLYAEEGRRIAAIQQEVVRYAEQADYDVFISYKETDENGARSEDSVLAQEIYDTLTAKGYKVFLSRVTLKGQAGMKYEPVIFAALNSAPVMLVVGTSRERMESVWVSNEWNRFLRLMEQDKDRKLEVVYKNMKRIDLPSRLRFMPQQDLSKAGRFGWKQDIAYDVESMLGTGRKSVKQGEFIRETDDEAADREVRNKYILTEQALELGNRAEALRQLGMALDIDPGRLETWCRIFRIRSDEWDYTDGEQPEPPGDAMRIIRNVMELADGKDVDEAQEAEDLLYTWHTRYAEKRLESIKQMLGNDRCFEGDGRRKLEKVYGQLKQYGSRAKIEEAETACILTRCGKLIQLMERMDRFQPEKRRKIQHDYEMMKEITAPRLFAPTEQAYRKWESQIPKWEEFCDRTKDTHKVFMSLCDKHESLDQAVRKYEQSRAYSPRRIPPFHMSMLWVLAYIAIAPVLMTLVGPGSVMTDKTGMSGVVAKLMIAYSVGSVILLAVYMIMFLGICMKKNETAARDGYVIITVLMYPLAILTGVFSGNFGERIMEALGRHYGVEMEMTRTFFTAECVVALIEEFRVFTAQFVGVLAVMAVLVVLGCKLRSKMEDKAERLKFQKIHLARTGCDCLMRYVDQFCKPYEEEFGDSIGEIRNFKESIRKHYYRTDRQERR